MEKIVGSSKKLDDKGHTKSLKKSNSLQKQQPKTREWKCNICFKEFGSQMTLRTHEDNHITPFCELCKKMFKTTKLLHLHTLANHSASQESKEDYRLSFSDEELNICENLSLSKVKEEPIELVSEPEIENLLNHNPHHSSITSDDATCNNFRSTDDFPSSPGIWRNFTETPCSLFVSMEHSSVPIKMEPADSTPDQFDLIINEILRKPPDNSQESKMSLVGDEFPMQQNFWTQSDHQEDNQIWNCDMCTRCFSTKQILQRHRIAQHEKNNDFKCDQCDLWFSSTNNFELIQHVNTAHNGFKKYICDFGLCNKEFSRRDALKRHRQTHESQKAKNVMQQSTSKESGLPAPLASFSCFDCGLNFRYQTSLILHLKNHKN